MGKVPLRRAVVCSTERDLVQRMTQPRATGPGDHLSYSGKGIRRIVRGSVSRAVGEDSISLYCPFTSCT